MTLRRKSTFVSGFVVFCLVNAGCASVKYVREAISPVHNQTNKTQDQAVGLQDQADANKQVIGALDREVAITSEKAEDAEKKASEAAEAAAKASAAAAEASRVADAATALALQVQHRVAELNSSQSYQLVSTDEVFFGVNRSNLSKEEQRKLDAIAKKIEGMKSYLVEVQGYADASGDKKRNRQLGSKRANTVVHFLSVEHRIPLRSIRQLGVGSDFPGADNTTAEARRLNRRVQVKIYVRDLGTQVPTS